MKSLEELPTGLQFHGVPQREWIGRTIKGRSVGKSRPPVKVVAFHSNHRVEVKPVNHGHNEIVHEDTLHPWWSRNDDLRKRYCPEMKDDEEVDILEKFSESLTVGTSLDDVFVAEEKATPKALDAPVAAPPSMNPQALPPPVPAKRTIRKLHVDPVNLSWMEDLKTFNEARNGKDTQHGIIEDALKELKHLDELEQLCITQMEEKGVVIEWAGETAQPEAPKSDTRPVRVGDGHAPKEPVTFKPSTTNGGLSAAAMWDKIKGKMSPGIAYTLEDLGRLAGMPKDQTLSNRVFAIREKGGIVAYKPTGSNKTHYKLP